MQRLHFGPVLLGIVSVLRTVFVITSVAGCAEIGRSALCYISEVWQLLSAKRLNATRVTELQLSTLESSRLDVYILAGSRQDCHVFVWVILLSAALLTLGWKPSAWCSIRDDSLCHRKGLIMAPVTNHVTDAARR